MSRFLGVSGLVVGLQFHPPKVKLLAGDRLSSATNRVRAPAELPSGR